MIGFCKHYKREVLSEGDCLYCNLMTVNRCINWREPNEYNIEHRNMLTDQEEKIRVAVEHAENKHPEFPKDRNKQLTILIEEIGEIANAILDCPENIENEIYDSIAVLIRMLKMEVK